LSFSVGVVITEWHRLDSLNSKYLFLTVLKIRSPRSGYQHAGLRAKFSSWLTDSFLGIVSSGGRDEKD
jgi:hypothetical protein